MLRNKKFIVIFAVLTIIINSVAIPATSAAAIPVIQTGRYVLYTSTRGFYIDVYTDAASGLLYEYAGTGRGFKVTELLLSSCKSASIVYNTQFIAEFSSYTGYDYIGGPSHFVNAKLIVNGAYSNGTPKEILLDTNYGRIIPYTK